MTLFQASGLVLAVVALFGYVNHRFFKLPNALGNTAVGLVTSVLLVAYGRYDPEFTLKAREVVANIDFSELVFHGFLALLLFAGSLHVNLEDLRSRMLPIFALSTVGVLVSTVVVGVGLHYGLEVAHLSVPLVYCMMFGALISPTDPIAVLSVLKEARAPKRIEAKIAGESLFNDGTGVVAFLLMLGLATHSAPPTLAGAGFLLLTEVVGGVVLGWALGWAVVGLLKGIDSYPVEITTTLAAVVGGYALAEGLHVSAPLTVAVLGLMVGTVGVTTAMSATTREHLFSFWGLIDEILNLVLFSLIGIKLLALSFDTTNLLAGLIAIPVVLVARWMSVVISLLFDPGRTRADQGVIAVLTWGGLRGGLSIALALSLPNFQGRALLVGATYAVVLFSLLVQAPTLSALVARVGRHSEDAPLG